MPYCISPFRTLHLFVISYKLPLFISIIAVIIAIINTFTVSIINVFITTHVCSTFVIFVIHYLVFVLLLLLSSLL